MTETEIAMAVARAAGQLNVAIDQAHMNGLVVELETYSLREITSRWEQPRVRVSVVRPLIPPESPA